MTIDYNEDFEHFDRSHENRRKMMWNEAMAEIASLRERLAEALSVPAPFSESPCAKPRRPTPTREVSPPQRGE